MSRFVVEATDEEKCSLTDSLKKIGKTYREWFEEQVSETVDAPDLFNMMPTDASAQLELPSSEQLAIWLKDFDWSFATSDTTYLTHGIHPYPAKYIPQLPGSIIEVMSRAGDTVCDPFGGSGTTALEAVRLGRKALSVDANPLANLIGLVKTTALCEKDDSELDLLASTLATYFTDYSAVPTVEDLLTWTPNIPNIEKWFAPELTRELALIRKIMSEVCSEHSKNIAQVALSRIIINVSYQDSETRYVSKPYEYEPGIALRKFLDSLNFIRKKVSLLSFKSVNDSEFHTGDSRSYLKDCIPTDSVGLIVTSPPYANATDYHLYHRFRLFWLGFNPKEFADVEIGSHLKHQRTKSGFETYAVDMQAVLEECYRVLIPSRYCALIVGDSIFKGELIDTAEELANMAEKLGFEHVSTVRRKLPDNRRSFSSPARRASEEKILVLRKPDTEVAAKILFPTYKPYDYEKLLLKIELSSILGNPDLHETKDGIALSLDGSKIPLLRKLSFARGINVGDGYIEKTWQRLLENGEASVSRKKEPKYVTHGIHSYKGKFYPQLAKSLINTAGISPHSSILDPFCGSGTVLLESHLNGYKSYGIDMNPLAVKIAKAKTSVLQVNPYAVKDSINCFLKYLPQHSSDFDKSTDELPVENLDIIFSWFPEKVVYKLNWLLKRIRLIGDSRLKDFFEVLLSDCIRNVSQQEPRDLRIRRRTTQIDDAPLLEEFTLRLRKALGKLEKFWAVSGKSPYSFPGASVYEGDCRLANSYKNLGIAANSVDLVVTSPPYATALPYIDTDRLSLMTILNISSARRKHLEENLSGSREIRNSSKKLLEDEISSGKFNDFIPDQLISELIHIAEANQSVNAGFRRQNMPSLLYRYFKDMGLVLENVFRVLKPGSTAYFVVGDSKTKAGDDWRAIETTKWLSIIGERIGFETSKLIEISVSTENLKHIKNAITENAVIKFKKPAL